MDWIQFERGHTTPGAVLRSLISLILVYAFTLVVNRLFFHPLRKVPGPRLGALSKWYGFYHNVIRDGQYSLSFASLHKKYSRSPTVSTIHVPLSSVSQQTLPSSASAPMPSTSKTQHSTRSEHPTQRTRCYGD